MRTIALVEPLWSGHHPTYLRIFTSTLLQLGYRVVVLCSEPEIFNRMISAQFSKLPDNLALVHYELPVLPHKESGRLGIRRRALWQLEKLAECLLETECSANLAIDLVFFCFIDNYIGAWQSAQDWERIFPWFFSGLYFHPVHLRGLLPRLPVRRGLLSPDNVLRSKYCRSIAVLDEGIADLLNQRIDSKRVITFPDFTDNSQNAQPSQLAEQVLESAQGRKVIGLLGSLERRKGVMDVLGYAQALQNEPLFFLIVGELAVHSFSDVQKHQIETLIQEPTPNILIFPERLADETEFNSLVQSCDLLYAVYHRFPHSSNLLTKAALMQVPIVVSDRFLMGERIRKYRIGFTVRENVPEDFISLVRSDTPFSLKTNMEFKKGCAEYLSLHSVERLASCFRLVIEMS